MDAALEKGLAPLAGPHAVVVAGGVVVTHGAEVHIDFGGGGGGRGGRAEGRVDGVSVLLGSLVCRLDGAAAGGSTSAVSQEHLDIWEIHTARFPVISLLAALRPPPLPKPLPSLETQRFIQPQGKRKEA